MDRDERRGRGSADRFADVSRRLWVEEPAIRYRMPDPVRKVAVRSVIIMSLTLIQAMVAFLSTLAGSWLAFPMVISSVASTVVATWSVLDVWVTRQVWNQRHGVVSVPSSTARQLRKERRRARREIRSEVREESRIRRRGSVSDTTWGAGAAAGRTESATGPAGVTGTAATASRLSEA